VIQRRSKYELVGQRLEGQTGLLLDVGARDRRLKASLPSSWQYRSADIGPGHDYQWNLEEPLPAKSRSFDAVVCLDVLEHVDNIHQALSELLRITRGILFISLPNMACLSLRLQFVRTGLLGDKYRLPPEPVTDRHRWLTTYRQGQDFIRHGAARAGFSIRHDDLVTGYGRLHHFFSGWPLPASLTAYTVLFELTRDGV